MRGGEGRGFGREVDTTTCDGAVRVLVKVASFVWGGFATYFQKVGLNAIARAETVGRAKLAGCQGCEEVIVVFYCRGIFG